MNCDKDDLESVALVFGAIVTMLCLWLFLSDQCSVAETHGAAEAPVIIELYRSAEDYYGARDDSL